MDIDTDDLSALIAERDALDSRIKEAQRTTRDDALRTCQELIKRYGFNAKDLGLRFESRKPTPVAPKFISPTGVTWAGRGRKPLWLQEEEKKGKSENDFRITTPDSKP